MCERLLDERDKLTAERDAAVALLRRVADEGQWLATRTEADARDFLTRHDTEHTIT